MESVKKVYLVSSGSYSDYGIDAVFSTLELAQRFCDEKNNDKSKWSLYEVDEYLLDPYEVEKKKGYQPYKIIMSKDGDYYIQELNFSDLGHIDSDRYCYFRRILRQAEHPNEGFELCNYGSFKSKEAAFKSTNEIRIRVLAANAWGNYEYLNYYNDGK